MAHKEFKQGVYKPINRQKYIGDKLPFYRSGYELKFMRWADANPNVLKWGSESIIVPYKSPIDGKMHRYFVDNVVIIKEGENIKKYLIEIKPHKQTQPPTAHGNKKQTTILYEQATYVINQSKWEAAKKWCKDHEWEFLILTEKHLP
jgi:hypothetical protein